MTAATRRFSRLLIIPALLVPSIALAAIQTNFTVPDRFHPARTLVLFEALAALALFCWVAWRRGRAIDRQALLVGCAATALALVLRIAGSQWAWFHENRHGYRYIIEIIDGRGGYMPPSTYYVLMNFASWLGPPGEFTIFLVNVLFSTATVPLLGLVAAQLSRSREAGWAAMGLWALSPYAIRLAATETYFNVGIFFLVAGVAASISAMRRLDANHLPIAPLVLATLCTALAAQTRATTVLWPATVLLITLGAMDVMTRRRWLALFGLALAVAFLLIPKIALFLGSEGGGGRYFEVSGFFDNLPRLAIFDRSVVSPLVLPLALVGGVLLIRGRHRLGIAPTLSLCALAAYPGALWLRALTTVRRCDGFFCVEPIVLQFSLLKTAPVFAGAALAVALTWFVSRSHRVDARSLPGNRRGGFATLGALLPQGLSVIITAHHVTRLRFDLMPTALVTILAGVGVAGIASAVSRRRAIASIVFAALIASALIPVPLLWRPYADPTEHRFLREEVIPVLAERDARIRLVFPRESEKSSPILQAWWDMYLPAIQVVPSLSDLEGAEGAESDDTLYAFIGYTCSCTHGRWEGDVWVDDDGVSSPAPPDYPPAEFIEGAPRIHPLCAAALDGVRWRAVATMEIPLFGMEGNNMRVLPGLEHVIIGLYQARPDQ